MKRQNSKFLPLKVASSMRQSSCLVCICSMINYIVSICLAMELMTQWVFDPFILFCYIDLRLVSVHISLEPTLGRWLFSSQLRLHKAGRVIGMKFIGLPRNFNSDLQGMDIKSNRNGDFIIREMRKRKY